MNLTIPELQRLGKLARTIRLRHATAISMIDAARDTSAAAMAEVLLCGNVLNEARGIVGSMNWPDWLGRKCAAVNSEQARIWMDLANPKHTSSLNGGTRLAHAYSMIGVII